jgi:hypothetical protein
MSDAVVDEDDDDDNDCDLLDPTGGDTTEEERVGVDGLPTGRAMNLFRFPSPTTTVSTIDPMSTLSPTSSPITRSHHHRRVRSQVGSPRPADILAGKVFNLDSDDHRPPHRSRKTRGSRSLSLRGYQPVMGQFDPVDSNPQKRAVIDHFSKDIPSPFRRPRRGTGASVARVRLDTTSSASLTPDLSRSECRFSLVFLPWLTIK